MDLLKKSLKLTDNKVRRTLERAQYALTYRQDHTSDDAAKTSHTILSLLKGDGDLLLELNSSLFFLPGKSREEPVFKCLDAAKELGLEYRYRKTEPANVPSFFERLLSRTREKAHELLVYIPAEAWDSEGIQPLILPFGARYYFTSESSGDASLLDDFMKMTDDEKLEKFGIIVFDMGIMGHMGINSFSLEPADIKKLLKII